MWKFKKEIDGELPIANSQSLPNKIFTTYIHFLLSFLQYMCGINLSIYSNHRKYNEVVTDITNIFHRDMQKAYAVYFIT